MLYLDTSAIVKTVLVEQESSGLSAFLRQEPSQALLTSAVAITELARAVTMSFERDEFPSGAPGGGLDVVQDRLDGLRIVAITTELLHAAGRVKPPRLRTLDAIHLATALHFREDLTAFVSYDRRLAEAAVAAGLPVRAPGQN